MKDFNIAKYLKENYLGSHGILGRYVDLKPVREEKEFGEQEAMPEPYKGPEDKLDGLGGEFEQEETVSELEKPKQIYTNDWMNNSIDEKRVGSWVCYYDDIQGVIYWIHDKINTEDIVVYGTPGWDGAEGIAVETNVDYGTVKDADVIGDLSYPDFESYAQDMKPYLDMVEKKWFSGAYNDDLDEEVTVSSSGVEMGQDSFDNKNGTIERMLGLAHIQFEKVSPIVRSTIESLRADGFDDEDILDFLATDFSDL